MIRAKVLAGHFAAKDMIRVDVHDGKFVFEKKGTAEAT
jgi:hypothetical protein